MVQQCSAIKDSKLQDSLTDTLSTKMQVTAHLKDYLK